MSHPQTYASLVTELERDFAALDALRRDRPRLSAMIAFTERAAAALPDAAGELRAFLDRSLIVLYLVRSMNQDVTAETYVDYVRKLRRKLMSASCLHRHVA